MDISFSPSSLSSNTSNKKDINASNLSLMNREQLLQNELAAEAPSDPRESCNSSSTSSSSSSDERCEVTSPQQNENNEFENDDDDETEDDDAVQQSLSSPFLGCRVPPSDEEQFKANKNIFSVSSTRSTPRRGRAATKVVVEQVLYSNKLLRVDHKHQADFSRIEKSSAAGYQVLQWAARYASESIFHQLNNNGDFAGMIFESREFVQHNDMNNRFGIASLADKTRVKTLNTVALNSRQKDNDDQEAVICKANDPDFLLNQRLMYASQELIRVYRERTLVIYGLRGLLHEGRRLELEKYFRSSSRRNGAIRQTIANGWKAIVECLCYALDQTNIECQQMNAISDPQYMLNVLNALGLYYPDLPSPAFGRRPAALTELCSRIASYRSSTKTFAKTSSSLSSSSTREDPLTVTVVVDELNENDCAPVVSLEKNTKNKNPSNNNNTATLLTTITTTTTTAGGGGFLQGIHSEDALDEIQLFVDAFDIVHRTDNHRVVVAAGQSLLLHHTSDTMREKALNASRKKQQRYEALLNRFVAHCRSAFPLIQSRDPQYPRFVYESREIRQMITLQRLASFSLLQDEQDKSLPKVQKLFL
jgi:hypothetical protein